MRELKEQIRECVVKQTNLVKDISDEEIKQLIDREIFKREECRSIAVWDKIQLQRDIFNSLRGLDVLQDLVEDSSITDGTRKIEIPLYSVEWLKMGLSTTSIFLRIPGRVANKYQFISF